MAAWDRTDFKDRGLCKAISVKFIHHFSTEIRRKMDHELRILDLGVKIVILEMVLSTTPRLTHFRYRDKNDAHVH